MKLLEDIVVYAQYVNFINSNVDEESDYEDSEYEESDYEDSD